MTLQDILKKLVERQDLTGAEMEQAMGEIMAGSASAAQIAAFLTALRMKGESVAEIAAAARVMRKLALPVELPRAGLLDIVGTGGDGASIFNVSTASIFVAAAAGARIAKHGNRAVSSRSGAADVLEAAGARLDLDSPRVAACVARCGVGFMFAPQHHGAARHAAPVRKELGLRTLFNLLGPLTNPAQAPRMLLGVYARQWLVPMAEVLRELGAEHVMVVHSDDGLDELSIAAPTSVAELRDGLVSQYRITPEDAGVERGALAALVVEDAAQSLRMIRAAFSGEAGPATEMIALNAGAALYVAGAAPKLRDGVASARVALASGAAWRKFEEFINATQTL